MLKTIARVLVLCLLAWFFSPLLNVILPLPTENMVDGFLDLEKESHQDLFKLMRFIVWVIILALAFRYTGPLFSFVLPITSRYSTTKPMRRFQGVFADALLFGVLLLFVGAIVAAVPSYKEYTTVFEEKKEEWKIAINNFYQFIDSAERENRHQAEAFIEANKDGFDMPFQIWPNEPSKGVEYYSIQDVIDNPEDYERHVYRFNEHGQYGDFISYDIRRTKEYQDFFKTQAMLYKDRKMLDSGMAAVPYDEDFQNEKAEEAKEKTWAEVGGIYGLYTKYFKQYFWWVFFATLAAYVTDYFYGKQVLGKIHERLLRFLELGRVGFGGSARFAGLLEEWRTLYKNQKEGLFMGRSLYNPFLYVGLEDSRHMMTIAGSRAGKGTSVIIPNLLLWKGSAVVIDPKGTNAAVTARRRNVMGQDVHIIDPFSITNLEAASFNPLASLDPDSEHIREQISMIAEALVVPDENQRERHWDDGAKTIIAGLIAHLVSSPKYEKPSLPMLRDLISMDSNDQAKLWAEMSMNDGAGRLAKDAAYRVIRGIGTNEISSILSNADKHTEWLSSPAMKKTLGSSSFNFAQMKDSATTIYLVIPPHYLETHNRFLRLFVNLAISQMGIGGRAKVPVLLMMDEFLALGKMNEVEKAFGLMAGYNLIMWPFVQDMGRLKNMYGASVNAFIANSRAIQVFGVVDKETKEFISEFMGDRRISKRAKIGGLNDVVPLRKPDEVAKEIEADEDVQYILRAGKAPLVLEKVRYYDSAPIKALAGLAIVGSKGLGIFHGLYDKDPDYSG